MRAIALLITFLPLFVETAPHNRSRVCSANRNSARHRLGHHQGNSTSNGTSTVSQVIIHFSDAVSSTSDPSESATASAFEGVPSSFSIRASLDGVAAVQIGGGPVTTVVVTTTSTVSSAIASASLDGAEALGISVGPGTTTVVTTTSTVTSTRLTSSKLVTISSFKVIEPSTTWTTVTPTVYTTVTPPVSVSSIAPPANTSVKSPPANIPSSAPAASTPGKPPPATTPIPPPSTTPVAAPPPAKAPATPPPATTPASAPDSAAALSERGNAVGIGWNAQSGTNIKSLTGEPGSKLSWSYNWDLPPSPNMAGLEFVPQVWGSGSVPGVKGSDAKWPSGTKYVLSFNEPDQLFLNGGCNIDAATAATLHQQWVKALGGSYSIGAPAVAWGGKPWLQNWKNACAGQCNYDFVPFHFYGTDPNALISYAQDMHTTFGKPLWLTEWACRDYPSKTICNQAQVEAFMKTAIDWFRGDGAGIVERWAWFGAFPDQASQGNANGVEQADGSANAVGTYYVSL